MATACQAALVATLGLASAGCAALGRTETVADASVRGPLVARPEHPLAATWLAFPPRRAATVAPGHGELGLDASYASFFESEQRIDRSVVVDAEILTVTARARFGVAEGSDVEVLLPTVLAGSGFLDSFVEGWHEFFNLPDGNRDSRPRNLYDVHLEYQGREVFDLEGGEWLVGDVPVIWTQRLVQEADGRAGVSVRVGLELPTGSASRGAGNGELDWGGGVLVEKSRGRWTFTGAADYLVTAESDQLRRAGLDADDLWNVQAGAEYRWNERTSLIGGLVLSSPMLTDFDLKEIERPILDLGLGVAWSQGKRTRWTLSFHEDLISQAGPDFGVVASWARAW